MIKFTHKEVIDELKKTIPGFGIHRTHRQLKKYIEELEIKENGEIIYEDGDDQTEGRYVMTSKQIRETLNYEWRYTMRPDGYKICRSCKIFHAYEVVDHHRLCDLRLANYYDLFDYLGNYGIDGLLHVFDRHGSERIWTTGELMEAFLRVHVPDIELTPAENNATI